MCQSTRSSSDSITSPESFPAQGLQRVKLAFGAVRAILPRAFRLAPQQVDRHPRDFAGVMPGEHRPHRTAEAGTRDERLPMRIANASASSRAAMYYLPRVAT